VPLQGANTIDDVPKYCADIVKKLLSQPTRVGSCHLYKFLSLSDLEKDGKIVEFVNGKAYREELAVNALHNLPVRFVQNLIIDPQIIDCDPPGDMFKNVMAPGESQGRLGELQERYRKAIEDIKKNWKMTDLSQLEKLCVVNQEEQKNEQEWRLFAKEDAVYKNDWHLMAHIIDFCGLWEHVKCFDALQEAVRLERLVTSIHTIEKPDRILFLWVRKEKLKEFQDKLKLDVSF
jgi:hypothetical protein